VGPGLIRQGPGEGLVLFHLGQVPHSFLVFYLVVDLLLCNADWLHFHSNFFFFWFWYIL
jgi:hypothetical protein